MARMIDNNTGPGSGAATAAEHADLYNVLGSWVEVRTSSPSARRAVTNLLRGFAGGKKPPHHVEPVAQYSLTLDDGLFWQVGAGEVVPCVSCQLNNALTLLEWQIVMDALGRRDDLFYLHGAALATPASREGVVLIGESGSGKTTLALGLMLRGFTPFNDDVTLIAPDTLELQSFRRSFHLEEGTRGLLHPLAVPASWDLDAEPRGYFLPPVWAAGGVPVRYVLFPSFQAGAAPELTRLTAPEAAGALLAHTSLQRAPGRGLATVARLTAQAACYRLRTGDLALSAAVVHALVEGQSEAAAHVSSASA